MVSMPDGMVDRYEVMARATEQLATPVADWLGIKPVTGIDREAWMRSTQAQAGQRAMMRAAGGAAAMRPPEAKRPEAWKAREGVD